MKDLFTVHQVSQCCGISRATILRLEEKGLLTPAFIDRQTGYRYYDTNNVGLVMQVKFFLSMDMSYDDILLYYRSNGSSPELLDRLEAKFLAVKRAYEEIRLRVDRQEHLSFEFIVLPRYVCYTGDFRGVTIEDRYRAMHGLYSEAVEKGLRLLPSEPLFVINRRTDFIEGKFTETEVDFTCCIPLEPDFAPPEAVVYPACTAFSCLCYGDYTRRAETFNAFGEKVRGLGLRPAGYVRALGLVAPYTGRDIPNDRYLSRLALPLEE